MAAIWPVYEGTAPTPATPWAKIPFLEAKKLFEPLRFLRGPGWEPKFNVDYNTLGVSGFRHIVVQVNVIEAKEAKVKPGFYLSKVDPKSARQKLLLQTVAAKLGYKNVVRVLYEPAIDSQGRDALRITVVIAPGAVKTLANGPVLDVLVNLHERMREMQDERVPIVEYATEAELKEDASS